MSFQDHNFFLTIEHPCAYYDDRLCQNIVPDPKARMQSPFYGQLATIGFRRSGGHVYRPHCPSCRDCIPCRINVARFQPSRSQRRNLKQNSQVSCREEKAEFTDEYFALYRSYLNLRHGDGDMKDPTEDDFKNFLFCNWSESYFLTLRENGQLLAVAVVDKVANGYSAMYTFYDPKHSQRGLGTLSILKEIEFCQQKQQPYLYLGYWIKDHAKMHYKLGFDATELFINNRWYKKEDII